MTPNTPDQALIEQAGRLLHDAQSVVALTGAGISTPSGIPDFRSHDTGLWEKANPLEVATLLGFRHNPAAFYQWIRPLAQLVLEADPNPAHRALTALEEMGMLKAVITQNIDMLHTRAGTQTVHEVHGHMRTMTCLSCFQTVDSAPYLEAFLEAEEVFIPRCEACQGVLKPDVVLFGEQLPRGPLNKAQKILGQADVMLVAGSSLEVHPVADFPRRVQQAGGRVIIVNMGPTGFDQAADVIIRGDVAEVLPALVRFVQSAAQS